MTAIAENARVAYSVREAAASLGISERGAWELVRAGQLRSVRLGARRLIPRVALDELLEELATEAAS